MQYARNFLSLLRQTIREWQEDRVPRMAAALSYYTALGLAPLLLVLIAMTGLFFGPEAAEGQIVDALSSELGPQMAEFLQTAVNNLNRNFSAGLVSAAVSLVALLVATTGLFVQMQTSLNEVWGIEDVDRSWRDLLKARLTSLGVLLMVGFLLIVSLVLSSLITAVSNQVSIRILGVSSLIQIVSFGVGYGITVVLIALIYKALPDARVEWRDVWIGAAVTAFLFSIGRWAVGVYVNTAGPASIYGAAGSFVLILIWVYYSAQIILFGAEFTQVFARRYGSKIEFREGAEEEMEATS